MEYKVKSGKLKLKGIDLGKPKKKSKKKTSKEAGQKRPREEISSDGGALEEITPASRQGPSRTKGVGVVTTLGKAVNGRETRFLDAVRPGDALEVHFPKDGGQEIRVVRAVLDETALLVNAPFSLDLTSECEFYVLKLPGSTDEEPSARKKRIGRMEDKDDTFAGEFSGPGNDAKEVTLRVRTEGGSYKTVVKKMNQTLTREEMLDLRSKKTSDRHCM